MAEPKFSVTPEFVRDLVVVAVKHKKQIRIDYVDAKRGEVQRRMVDAWEAGEKTFGGWCHLRNNFRNFSYDRVIHVILTDYIIEHNPEEYVRELPTRGPDKANVSAEAPAPVIYGLGKPLGSYGGH